MLNLFRNISVKHWKVCRKKDIIVLFCITFTVCYKLNYVPLPPSSQSFTHISTHQAEMHFALFSSNPTEISHYNSKQALSQMKDYCYDFGGGVGKLCDVDLAQYLMFPPGFRKDNVSAELISVIEELNIFCNKHNIDLILDSGSLIGAVRQGSILPWDDDTDAIMTKRHLDELLLLKDELKEIGFGIELREFYVKVYRLNGRSLEKYKWKWPFIDIFPVVPREASLKALEVISTSGDVPEVPQDVIFPVRRVGRLGPCKNSLFAIPNDPVRYLELSAGEGWKTGMIGTANNHREERAKDNANNMLVPYEVMQLYVPVLMAQVRFSTSKSLFKPSTQALNEIDDMIKNQKTGIGKLTSYNLVGRSRSGRGTESLDFHIFKMKPSTMHTVMENEDLFSDLLVLKSHFIEETMSQLMQMLLSKNGIGIGSIYEGSGIMHYYGMRGVICERRISYSSFVDISSGAKGVEEGKNWCEVIVESGNCTSQKLSARVLVNKLYCMKDEIYI